MWQQGFSLILCAIISGSVSVGWKLTVSPVVKVSRGEDAVLSCFFTHKKPDYSGTITVKWIYSASRSPPFFECSVKNDSMDGDSPCAFSDLKHSLKGDPRRGEASLLIRKVQLTDIGPYFCRVELDGWRKFNEAKTELHVEVEPQILNISVVETPCGKNSAPQSLQCEVEGNPLPKIVWLSASRRQLENQSDNIQIGSYRVTRCVPYLKEDEDQVFTCRAESALNHAERTYPTSSPHSEGSLTLIVCGVIALLVLITGIVFYCLRRNRQQQVSDPPVEGGEELQVFYSVAAMPDPASLENHQQQVSDCPAEGGELETFYSEITTPESTSYES